MKLVGAAVFTVLVLAVSAYAETVQVPELCAAKQSPCVIRTDEQFFIYKQQGLQIKIVRDSIVKVIKTENHLNFDILKGRIELQEYDAVTGSASINDVLIDGNRVMAHRLRDNLEIYDLNTFSLARYQIKQGVYPDRLSQNFISKADLVQFTRHYFTTVDQFKAFLSSIEKKWIAEFKLQNENQTKALLRSVASEEKAVEERVQQKMREEKELKKVRNELFFRTFQR
jgi:hypothetical protein